MNSLLQIPQRLLQQISERFPNQFGNTPSASQFHVTAFLLLLFAGYLAFSGIMLLLYPDLGPKLVIAACGGFTLMWLGPRVTFPLYFATWFSTALPVPGLPVSLNRALAAAMLASWLAHCIRFPLRVPRFPGAWLLMVMTLYAVTLNILMKDTTSPASIQQVVYFIMGLLVFSVYKTKEDYLQLARVLVMITAVITSVGIVEFILRRELFAFLSETRITATNIRINGISKNAIQYAFNATWALPLALVWHIQARTRLSSLLTLGLVIYLLTACLLTFNRQTPIILGAMIFVGLMLVRYKYRIRLLAVFLLITAAITPFVVGKILERYNNIGESRPDVSIAVRADKFRVAREILRDHWVLGIGLNNFKDYWFEYKPRGELYQIHTDPEHEYYIDLGYMQLLTETGIVGLLAFVALMVISAGTWFVAWWRSLKIPDPLVTNILAALAMNFTQLLISNLIQDTFYTPHTYLLFFLFFAALVIAKQEGRSQQNGDGVSPSLTT